MSNQKKLQIGVIGSAGPEEYPKKKGPTKFVLNQAEQIGYLLAQQGVIVVTGGKSGIMEAASRGAKNAGGMTVGIIKGKERFKSNSFVDVEMITGMIAEGLDELLLVLMCDAVIVIGGGAGTLQEVTLAYRNKKLIIILDKSRGWAQKLAKVNYLDERKLVKIMKAKNAKQAVKLVLNSVHHHVLSMRRG